MKKIVNHVGIPLFLRVPSKFYLTMRIALFLIFVSVLQGFATETYSQMTHLTLNLKNVSVRDVLQKIENESEYHFLFNHDLVDVNRKVNIQVKNKSIEDVLNKLFENKSVAYKVVDRQIVLLSLKTTGKQGAVVRKKKISGKVINEKAEPVLGATVLIKGSGIGTVTDAKGIYSIEIDNNAKSLVFSYVGMKPKEVSINGKEEIDVTLSEDFQGLNEVVVVGYGTQKKINLTGSVASVSSKDLVKRQVGSASLALQGLVPGVTIQQTSGQPGADGANIRIRGMGSMNAGQYPLVLIDGIESDINNIDINSIESISVLKDAASASIYGARAANGVILITTKRAKDEKMQVSYSSYVAIEKATDLPSPVSAVEYMQLINKAKANNNEAPQYSQSLIDSYVNDGADNFNRYDTNWRDLVMKKQAYAQNHTISLTGGSEKLKYYATGNFYDQGGLIQNNSFKRYSMRANTDAKLNNWLSANIDLSMREGTNIQPSISSPASIIRKALSFPAVFSGLNNDGSWGNGQNGDNPAAVAKDGGTNKGISSEVVTSGKLIMTPIKGLEGSVSYIRRAITYRGTSFIRPYNTYESGSWMTLYPPTGSQLSESWSKAIHELYNAQLNYQKTYKQHQFSVLGGFSAEDRNDQNFSASRRNFQFDGFEYLSNGDAATMANDGGASDWSMASFYSRINYSYKDRYLLEMNGRWDGSSRFVKGNKWSFFPSISAGWRINEENFMKQNLPMVSNLKLRGSYGVLGNQDIGTYPFASTLGLGWSTWFNKQLNSGVAQTDLANPDITWEKSTQLNLGLDAGLFKDKLSFGFDYYIRRVTNMLQKLPIPDYIGLSAPWQNAGSMQNRGWEFTIGHKNSINDFHYSVNFTLSDVRNKVTDLNGKVYTGNPIAKEGYALWSYYGYVSDGYFQNQNDIDTSPVQFGNRANTKPGYIKYKDISGPAGKPDGVIDDFDRTVLGNSFPRFEYGLNLAADWKGFDMSVFIQGVGKRDYYISGYGAQPFYVGGTMFNYQKDFWTPDNPNAKYPLLLIDGSGNNPNYKVSDHWVKNAAYLRVKNLVLGYTIPKTFTQKVNVNSVRAYVSAQNLFTYHHFYQGYDPEIGISGGEFYPIMKTFSFGLDLKF